MRSAYLLCLCVLLAGQLTPAQTASFSAADGIPPSLATTARRHPRAHRRFTNTGAQSSPEQVLYTFQGNDGANPIGNLIFDSSGNLYGVTEYGGTGNCHPQNVVFPGCGTVYKLNPNESGGWTYTTLYNFQGGNDGEYPNAGLILDNAGNLYGTTLSGGTGVPSDCGLEQQCGTVFELSPNGASWTETVLYSFQGGTADGAEPVGLIFDTNGNLYGVTSYGGTENDGTVYELIPHSGGGWTDKILYSFDGKADGSSPASGLTFDAAGNLYGSATGGGSCCGAIFELSPSVSGSWTETTLHQFSGNPPDAASPNGGLLFDSAGNLWGSTLWGNYYQPCGPYEGGCGTVFELSPNGGGS